MEPSAPTHCAKRSGTGPHFSISSAGESSPDDDRLVAAIAAGLSEPGGAEKAQQAFLGLYDRHARELLAYIARTAKPSAVDDIAQDAWRKAWERLADRPPGAPFRPWLFAVTRNLITDSYRDATRRRAVPLGEESSPELESLGPDVDQGMLDEDVRVALSGCLDKLTDRPREVVRLRWRGDDYAGVCQALNIDHNQAYKAYHQAVRQLGECLKRSNVV